MVKVHKPEVPSSSPLNPFLPAVRAQLEGIGFSDEVVAAAMKEIQEARQDGDALDADSLFDAALIICNRINPAPVSDDDSDIEAENKQIDEARIIALETAEDERDKRRSARKKAWKSCDLLSEEELRTSPFLLPVRNVNVFQSWCAARPEEDGKRKSARLTASLGPSTTSHSSAAIDFSPELICFRSNLADLLELESDTNRWYGDRSKHLFGEIGEKLLRIFPAQSVPANDRGKRSASSAGHEQSSEAARNLLSQANEILASEVASVRKVRQSSHVIAIRPQRPPSESWLMPLWIGAAGPLQHAGARRADPVDNRRRGAAPPRRHRCGSADPSGRADPHRGLTRRAAGKPRAGARTTGGAPRISCGKAHEPRRAAGGCAAVAAAICPVEGGYTGGAREVRAWHCVRGRLCW